MNDIVLAVDLGGTNLRMAAVTRDGSVLHLARAKTPRDVLPDHLIDLTALMAAECRDAIGDDYPVCGIAFAAPAPAAADNDGILNKLPNLPSLNGMNLKGELFERFRLPIMLENDATAAAIGENWLGASKDVNDSIMMTLGTGVGGGIVINNKPFRGIDGTAGEIGHINVEPDGHPCGCGSHGCIEQYASATAIVRMAREAGLDVQTSRDVYELCSPPYEGGVDALRGRGGSLVRTGSDSDWVPPSELASAIFQKMGRYLGITLAGLVNTLNPEMIILGGGAAAGWDAFIEPLKTELHYRAFDAPANRAQIVRSELGDNAGILGAARSAFLAS